MTFPTGGVNPTKASWTWGRGREEAKGCCFPRLAIRFPPFSRVGGVLVLGQRRDTRRCMYSIVAIRLTRDKRRQRRWKERTKENEGGGRWWEARWAPLACFGGVKGCYPRGHRFTGEPASRKNWPERINISRRTSVSAKPLATSLRFWVKPRNRTGQFSCLWKWNLCEVFNSICSNVHMENDREFLSCRVTM